MQNNQKKTRFSPSGFTLIELSIVLVIIGLIAGGILTGQDLIKAAAVRSQIKQIQDYQIAFNTFRNKYNCIPGDCLNATQFFGTTDPAGNTINNGNGNGLIDTSTAGSTNIVGTPVYWNTSTELWGAIQQLSLAQMINFQPGATITTAIIGKTIPAVTMNPAAALFIGASYNFNTAGGNPDLTTYQKGTNVLWLTLCSLNAVGSAAQMSYWDDNCGTFTAMDTMNIDKKIDDGMPLTGSFLGFGTYGTSNNDCLNISGAASTYKLTNNTQQCQSAFIIN